MTIRAAKKEDIQTLQKLSHELFADNHQYDPDLNTDWAHSDRGKKYFTGIVNNAKSICLIAEEDNAAVGYIAAVPKDFGYRRSTYIEIENIGVSPGHRSNNIGSRLITACLKIAKERGVKRAYVNSYFENHRAVRFYENNGFIKIDVSLEKDI